jgi:putative oxidoreductase
METEKTRHLPGVIRAVAVTILRVVVVVGLIMVAHGWGKLTALKPTVEAFTSMGIPAPEVSAYLAIAGELFGGLGLAFGLFTPVAALGVACVMIVAITQVHWPNGLMAQNGGFEYPLTLLVVAIYYVAHGAGPFSVDAAIARRLHAAPPHVPPPHAPPGEQVEVGV